VESENVQAAREPGTNLEKARGLSIALYEAARRARMSTRSRRELVAGGFEARRGRATMRWALWASGLALVAVPTLAAALYFGLVASDQYEAEAQFTVQGGDPPAADGIGALTGLPPMAALQDTQVVTSYIQSRAAVEKLDAQVGLRAKFSEPTIDFWARFDRAKPIEKLVNYWESMSDVSVKMPSGIVVLKVRAFRPVDAVAIADAVVAACESLVNDMSDRMLRDAVGNAEAELARTSDRLGKARAALEKARNDDGVLDAGKAADALNGLIAEAKGAQLALQREYASQLRALSKNAPQMQSLQSRIDATGAQIAELQSKLTNAGPPRAGDRTLAATMTLFSELDIERQTAERQFSDASAALQGARIAAERKRVYLNAFVKPATPEEPRYPRRALDVFLVFASTAGLWGCLAGLVALVRNHMA
jgi:capsular polysaccharide transport system permease protein